MSLHSTHLRRALDDIESATRRLTPESLERQSNGKWSPAQILEHLALGFGATAKGLARCLEAGRPAAGARTLRHRFATLMVVTFGYLPSGRTAPERTRPRGLSGEAAMQAIRANLIAMDEALAGCAQRFGTRVAMLDHPILGPLSVAQWRTFHRVHTRHHMKQIESRRLRGHDPNNIERHNDASRHPA